MRQRRHRRLYTYTNWMRTGGSASRNRACRLRRWRSASGRKSWAEQEFGGALLGDARLSARLVTCARHQAEAPAFTGAAKGDRALIKAYYRFIDKPDNEAVTVENILQPHRYHTKPTI